MNKREIIEGTLGQLVEKIVWYYRHGSDAQVSVKELIESLAEQAIAVECEVEHVYDRESSYGNQFPMTIIRKGVWVLETFQGHQGTEGPYLFIGLPLPPKEEPE